MSTLGEFYLSLQRNGYRVQEPEPGKVSTSRKLLYGNLYALGNKAEAAGGMVGLSIEDLRKYRTLQKQFEDVTGYRYIHRRRI